MPSVVIRQACLDDIQSISCNLLQEDHREIVEGAGINPVLSISYDVLTTNSVTFSTSDGRLMGVAGVSQDGCIWMHCTPVVKDIPILFCKEARRWIESLDHPLLYNWADVRNTLHLKLLKHLGFKFLRVVPYGPNNLYFVEFVRLWSSSVQHSR